MPSALLAFDADHDRPPPAHGRRALAVDAACMLLAYLGAALAVLEGRAPSDLWASRPVDGIVAVLVAVLVPPAVLGCRRWPVAVATITLIGFVVSPAAGAAAAIAALTVRTVTPDASFTMAGASLVAVLAAVAFHGPLQPYRPLVGLLVIAAAIEVGLILRIRRQLADAAKDRERVRRLEEQRNIERARLSERLRIGREIHDALGHRLTLLNLHAGALTFRTQASAEEITAGLDVIQHNSAAALIDLQEAIGALRSGEVEPPVSSPSVPPPSLAALPQLIEEARVDGTVIESSLADRDEARPSDSSVERTVYRIVQEALTNARRHAPGAAITLHVVRNGRTMDVHVENQLTCGPSALRGSGTGLVGLEERATLAGGTLRYGPTGDGRFVLDASIPSGPEATP